MSSFAKMKKQTSYKSEHIFTHSFDDMGYIEGVYNDDGHPEGRHYVIPQPPIIYGPTFPLVYPSCTNVLSQIAERKGENGWLEAWKERVGEDVANDISMKALRRGSAFHDLAERYLLNKEVSSEYLNAWKLFKVMMPEFNKIDKIMALEHPLFSILLNAAGRVDCIGEYDGVPALIDFKTSRLMKEYADIGGYLLQVTMYSMMFFEMFGIRLEMGYILMGVDNGPGGKPCPKVFEVFFGDHRKTVIDEIADMRKEKGIPFDREKCYKFFL